MGSIEEEPSLTPALSWVKATGVSMGEGVISGSAVTGALNAKACV